MSRCTICYTRISDEEPEADCPTCLQHYHQGCWAELGGCATYGCKSAPAPEKTVPRPAALGQGWGDTKQCPACNREISSSLLVCRCGSKFPFADPMSPAEFTAWRNEQDTLRGVKRLLVVLFVVTLLGVVAPISGAIAGVYGHKQRERLAGENGTFLAIAYGSAGLGAVYTMVVLLLLIGL